MRKPHARKNHPTNISPPEIRQMPWSYFVVIAICGCVLAAGFFLAARQHFTSMDLGMKNSSLRRQLEDLESENRRLTLAREIAISPAEITKTARHLGFLEVGPEAAALPIPLPRKETGTPQVKNLAVRSTAFEAVPASLTMTAYQRPVKATVAAASLPSTEKTAKKAEAAKQKTIKPELTAVAKR